MIARPPVSPQIGKSLHRWRPTLLITAGDPSGVGPEIIVKALANPRVGSLCRPIVVGPPQTLFEAARRWAPSLKFREISSPPLPAHLLPSPPPGRIELIPIDPPGPHPAGVPTASGARAAAESLSRAAELAISGKVDAVVTAPIYKEGMRRAGFPFPGHTEFFAAASKSPESGMMMVAGSLKIMLATIHVPLLSLGGLLSVETVLRAIRLSVRSLKEDFGRAHPKIGVAALNPHAGEEGMLGAEEEKWVAPAVALARGCGISAFGPLPADTLFRRLADREFDAAVALYHDQALIPIKLLAFGRAVNLTVGLPFVRTSVDHGTAFDIAGRGIADPGSLLSAMDLAARIARRRRTK